METTVNDSQMTRLEVLFSLVQRYKTQLKKRWWVLLLCTSIAVCFQAWRISNEPIMYVSFARIVAGDTVNLNKNTPSLVNQREFFGTQMELVQSGEVRRRALERLEAMRSELEPVPVEIEVTRTRNSSILNLQSVGEEPEYTQAYLDALLDEYMNIRSEMRTDMTDTTLNNITEELLRMEQQVNTDQTELETFLADNDNDKILILQRGENPAAAQVAMYKARRDALQTEYDLYELMDLDQTIERRQSISEESSFDELSALAVGTAEREFITTKQQFALIESDLETMAQIYKPDHPRMIEKREELQRFGVLLSIYQEQSLENLKKQQDTLALQIKNLEAQIEAYQEEALEIDRRLAQHQRIVAKIDHTREMYQDLLISLRDIDLNKNLAQDSTTIMERATASTLLEPHRFGPILSGLGVGVVLGIGILILVDRLDDRMNTLAEFQTHFSEDVLGHIPLQSEKDGTPILQPDDERHVFAESYRNLRSSILFKQWGKEPPKIICLTSAVPSEGKTTTASNLALTMATAGAKVLLVDCDLRRGSMHDTFEVDNNPGMGEILTEQNRWEDAVVATKTPNLFFIPRGEHLSQTSEYLLSSITPVFLKEAREQYDYVIIDSAPIMAADDTTSLAPYVDTVVFVVKLSSTPARLVGQSLDQLYDRQVNVGGVVLNQMNTQMRDYNYYNYYSYYSHHGYLDYYTAKPKA